MEVSWTLARFAIEPEHAPVEAAGLASVDMASVSVKSGPVNLTKLISFGSVAYAVSTLAIKMGTTTVAPLKNVFMVRFLIN